MAEYKTLYDREKVGRVFQYYKKFTGRVKIPCGKIISLKYNLLQLILAAVFYAQGKFLEFPIICKKKGQQNF